MEATGDTTDGVDMIRAGGADAAEMTHTGGKRAAVQDEKGADQTLNKKLCTTSNSSNQDEDHCTFVIPSGEKFQISRAALRCKPLNDTLLARLVASPLGTALDASGAIEIGFECSADAFSRVVDEFEWALRVSTNRPDDAVGDILHNAGPALRTIVHPNALAPLWDYLSMPKAWLSHDRTHAGSTVQALVAHLALQRGLLLALQLQCFVQCIPNLPELFKLSLSYATETEPNRISFAVATSNTYRLGSRDGRDVMRHFTPELFRLLESPAQVKELCRMHGIVDLADQICVRPCTDDDVRRVATYSMPAFMPVLDERDVLQSVIAASRPVGCFAVRVKRESFYSDSIQKNRSFAQATVPLPCGGHLGLNICASTGIQDWMDESSGQPQLRIEATLTQEANSKSYARPDMPIPVVTIGLDNICVTFGDCADPELQEKSKQWQRAVVKTFFDETAAKKGVTLARSQTSKLMPHDHVSKIPLDSSDWWTGALTPVPWADYKSLFTADCVLDMDVESDEEKRRIKAGEEGWDWVNFIFTLGQSDAVPGLRELYDDDGVDYKKLTTSDLVIVEMTG